jgi:hypothetical protein
MDDLPIERVEHAPDASAEESAPSVPRIAAPIIGVVAWFVPGAGHLLLRRRIKAAAFFVVVAGLALAGYAMRGDAFAPGSDGPFGTLGFIADAGSGIFYFMSRIFESAGGDLTRAAGDYGTRLLAAAGIVNILGIFDACETAARRRF